jgi:hypothetical protein
MRDEAELANNLRLSSSGGPPGSSPQRGLLQVALELISDEDDPQRC